jgi:hypothetical protein
MIKDEIKEIKARIREYENARDLVIAFSKEVYNPISIGIYMSTIERCDQKICDLLGVLKILEATYE